MRMRVATIFYNDTIDDTTIKLSDDYESCDGLLRADIMQDCLGLVATEYEKAIGLMRDEFNDIRSKKIDGNDAS